MPSTRDIFDFYLSAEELAGQSHLVTIEKALIKDVFNPRLKQNEPRLSLHFHKARLTMFINKTQAIALERITGTDDYTLWKGHQAILSPSTTQNGQQTIVISQPPEKPPDPERDDIPQEEGG